MTLSQSFAFFASAVVQSSQRRQECLFDLHRGCHMDRRGERVVGALPHVHVVVGVNQLFLGHSVAAGDLGGPIADHFVDIHVAAGAAAGLKDVNRELVGQLSLGDFGRGLQHGVDLAIDQRVLPGAGQFPQVAVGHAAGILHHPHGRNHRRRQSPSADREILNRTLGLCAVVSIGGNADFAHRVTFRSVFSHRFTVAWSGGEKGDDGMLAADPMIKRE